MPWYVITKEAGGTEERSSAFGMEERALGFACDLLAAGVRVLRIEGPEDAEISGKKVAERCSARKVRRPTRQ